MKRVLILGAGFLQSFLIKHARKLGYYTIAIDKNPCAEAFAHANEYEVIDIVDQKACLKFAISKKIDGVVTAATDYGVLSTAYVAQEMGLPGLSYNVAQTMRNKYLVRKRLHETGIDGVNQYYEVSTTCELDKLKKQIRFPVIVKPCDGSGSRAVEKVSCFENLERACVNAINASLAGKALIEEFIHGQEVGAEAFVYNGQCIVIAIMDKRMTDPPYYAELGHCYPSTVANTDNVKDILRRVVKALGVDFGAVNFDIIVTDDHRVCIIDVGARMGGNLIGSHIVPLGTGVDYMGNLIRASVGDPIDTTTTDRLCVATRLLALTPGKVKTLPDFERISREHLVQVYPRLNVGDVIRQYKNNLDGCGYVVSVGDDLNEVELRVESAKNRINREIVREI